MTKKLSPKTVKYLLDMYNSIFEEVEMLKTWKHTIITPLLKEGKDPKNVRSVKPVALTNIVSKIFKRMANKEEENKINDRELGFKK